jgi:hypothetical protein
VKQQQKTKRDERINSHPEYPADEDDPAYFGFFTKF